jgi:hypothetical protein
MPEGNPKDALLVGLATLGITEVVLVDNRLEPRVDPAGWIEFVRGLRSTDPGGFRRLSSILDGLGHGSPDETPDVETYEELISSMVDPTGPGWETLRRAKQRYGERELIILEEFLGAINLQVSPYARAAEVPTDRQLYFVDYRMNEDPRTPGEDAKQLLRRIVDSAEDSGNPPGVILMSRIRPGERVDWLSVAKESGYLRFNFRFVDKVDLVRSADVLRYHLLDLVQGVPLGRAYFRHVGQVREALKSVAEEVTHKVMGLTPGDFGIFSQQVLQDPTGHKAVNHLTYLLSNLIDVALRNNPGVAASLEAFRGTLTSHPPMALEAESDSLHQIHAELLYDRSPGALGAPLGFGDIYWSPERDSTVLYLVITPECDLEPRKDGGPKVSSILLVTGRISPSYPGPSGDSVVTPLFIDEGGRCCWVRWNLQEPVVVDASLLVSARAAASGEPLTQEPELVAPAGADPVVIMAAPDAIAGRILSAETRTAPATADVADSLVEFAHAGSLAVPSHHTLVGPAADAGTGPISIMVSSPQVDVRPVYSKWGRLLRDHAERVQQRYATDLLEVGTEELLDATHVHRVPVLDKPDATSAATQVSLIECRMGKEVYLALGGDCCDLLVALPDAPSSDEVFSLRHLSPAAEFKKRCERNRLVLKDVGNVYYLIRTKGGVARNWEPKLGH